MREDRALPIRSTKQRILLATLVAHRGRAVSAEKLVESLWDSPPPSAWENLRLHVYQLRRLLGSDRIAHRPGGYCLVVEPGEVDAEEFEELVRQGDRLLAAGQLAQAGDLLARALALWRGPAYGDLAELPFVQQAATRLNEARLRVIEQRVGADLALGRHAELTAELTTAVAENPLRERLRAHLMLTLYRSGRQAEALSVYREGRRILVSELGIEPGPELRALHASILREDVPEPARDPAFVGRKQELSALRKLVVKSPLLTLTGMGGVGKSRLATRLAAQQAAEFADGTYVADLASLRDPELVGQALIRALGPSDRTSRPPLEVLAEYLEDKELLIILDTCEHVAAGCARILEPLLRSAPRLRVLATSRQPLGVPGEQLFIVQPLPEPDAVALFLDRAAAADPGFSASEETVAQLCRLLDGLPLALELAASRVATMSIDQIRLGLHELSPEPGRADRHRTLDQAIEWSHRLCTRAERLLWARASVFAGSFDMEAAAAVCCDEEVTVRAVAGLVEKSVLVRQETSAGTRYLLLDLLRHYGGERLHELGELERTWTRLLEHCLALGRRFAEEWHGPAQLDWFERLRHDRPVIEAVLESCAVPPHGGTPAGLVLATAMWPFWSACGLLREGRHHLDRLLAATPEPGPLRQAALRACGHLAIGQGDLDAAERMAIESRHHQVVGEVAALRGDTARGAELTARAVRELRASDSPASALLPALVGRGFVLFLHGDLDGAATVLAKLDALCSAAGETWIRSWGDYLRAQVELARGNVGDADVRARASLAARERLDDRLGMATSLDVMAQAAAGAGDGRRAAVLLGIGRQVWYGVGLGLFRSAALQKARLRCEQRARDLLGHAAYEAAFDEGFRLDLPAALDYARADARDDGRAAGERPASPYDRPGPVVPAQLPPDVAGFAGRGTELAQLNRLLDEAGGAPVLAGLTGLGGVGKTGLAVHWAHSVAGRFPHGQLYIDLRGYHDSDRPVPPGQALDRFLRSLGVPGGDVPADLDDRAALFRSTVASRRILLVLDNAHESAQVRPLLPGSAGCAVVVTSRNRLDGLVAKDGATVIRLGNLSRADSLALLSAQNRGAGTWATGGNAHRAALARIAELCAGLPLALRIAAARLSTRAHLTASGLADRLADERLRLDELRHGDVQVRAGFELTYRELSDLAAAVFRRAATLDVPDFPAWLVAPMVDTDVETVADVLEQLVDAHLLDVSGRDALGMTRYRFHDLVQLYARERATIQDGPPRAVEHALGALLSMAESAHRLEYGGDFAVLHGSAVRHRLDQEGHLTVRPLEWLAAERQNLVAGVAQAAALGLDELAWDLAMTAVTLFEAHSLFDEWRQTHETALAAARQAGNRRGEAAMVYGLGSLALFRHEYETAQGLLREAAAIFREIDDEHGLALALRNIALLHRTHGEFDRALTLYERAKRMLTEAGDKAVTAHVLGSTAQIHLDAGEVETATEMLDTALALFQEIGNQRGQAQVLYRLGEALLLEGHPEAARARFAEALPLVREMGDRTGEAHVLRGYGQAHLELGRLWDAELNFIASLRIAEANGERFAQARASLALGVMYGQQGSAAAAREHLDRAVALFAAMGETVWLARARTNQLS